jgi:Predicted endonuclease containing a URI domain
MHYLYVLKSKQDGDLYIGSTTDLRRRLVEHNDGLVVSTKSRRPFVLVYYEAYASLDDARLRESRLKQRGQARAQLMRRINKSLQVES